MTYLSQVHQTVTVTATPSGVDLTPLMPELYAQDRLLLLFQPGRPGDVELRHEATDAATRHPIPQDAGGNEPYPDGPWAVGSMPLILWASSSTEITLEIVRLAP